jgi:hypothetical protein
MLKGLEQEKISKAWTRMVGFPHRETWETHEKATNYWEDGV